MGSCHSYHLVAERTKRYWSEARIELRPPAAKQASQLPEPMERVKWTIALVKSIRIIPRWVSYTWLLFYPLHHGLSGQSWNYFSVLFGRQFLHHLVTLKSRNRSLTQTEQYSYPFHLSIYKILGAYFLNTKLFSCSYPKWRTDRLTSVKSLILYFSRAFLLYPAFRKG